MSVLVLDRLQCRGCGGNDIYIVYISNAQLLVICKGKLVQEEEFEDTKGVIRIRKSKKDRKHNDQKKKDKMTKKKRSTKHTYKTKDRVTRTPLKTAEG